MTKTTGLAGTSTKAAPDLRQKAQQMAERSLGCELEVGEGKDARKGRIIACTPSEPRESKSGKSAVQLWLVSLRYGNGRIGQHLVEKLPQKPHESQVVKADWSLMDELAKIIKGKLR